MKETKELTVKEYKKMLIRRINKLAERREGRWENRGSVEVYEITGVYLDKDLVLAAIKV